MKTSEILLDATKYLEGHPNGTAIITSDFICNAIEHAQQAGWQQAVNIVQAAVNQTLLDRVGEFETCHYGPAPTLSMAVGMSGRSASKEYHTIRNQWLADLIEKLQKEGD